MICYLVIYVVLRVEVERELVLGTTAPDNLYIIGTFVNYSASPPIHNLNPVRVSYRLWSVPPSHHAAAVA